MKRESSHYIVDVQKMMCKKLRNATRLFGLLSGAGIAQLCPTRGTRTPFNQDLGPPILAQQGWQSCL